ncbi:MAG: hypothetical protein GX060_07055, partial [Firmicutes bacterium]|nr:hypothetical protein [Bacillota bacterium]
WAVYPGTVHNEMHEDHSVRLMALSPDTNLDSFIAALANSIDAVLAKSQ